MNGAKARSQSFSAHAGDKPPTEGPGRVRTQIITNTAERGSSLTRQSSSEGSPSKTPAAPTPEGLPGTGRLPQAPSRQGSLGSTGSACSQQGSPSKVPLRIPPPSEGPLPTPGPEDPPACTQGGCPGVAAPEGAGRDPCGGPPAAAGCPRGPQSPGRTQGPSGSEASRAAKPEASGRYPDPAVTRTAASPEAPLSPSIEEKVMLCIQENVEKGQVQTKATSVEARPRPGPSFASWFGFRRSRLPALSSSRKMEVSKPKVEKKDAKGLGFGHKQLKAERKKDKKKPELQQSEVESELRRDAGLPGPPDAGFHSKSSRKAAQDICEQVKFEPRNRASPVACPTKDTFMTELLSRVDKRAAQQTESGSSNVSCRSVLKGSSQGPCLTSGSSSAQGNHKKTLKTKAEAEMPRGSLVKETTENLQEDEEDTVVDSAFQSHIIGKNLCLDTSLAEIFSP
ncbi:hypothetical protein QTO34_003043 [Cnephaeus nilssonii]|uniref:Nck-associated protein 5 C-terminal domain-containing protein n=1 Tax=Cnephaeus nilssonii TaxID=3371016 RepID=A0AA40HTE3_CNENI|nr:hypothetical protein QTO34_003043 [Eptesicus nilssonii]